MANSARLKFVLVHGGFHGGWCWDPVVQGLEDAGHSAFAVDLAGRRGDEIKAEDATLADHVARIRAAVDAFDEPVVLVAHSMGGVISSEFVERYPRNVRRLVYLSAGVPVDGEAALEGFQTLTAGTGSVLLDDGAMTFAEDGSTFSVSPDVAQAAFFHRCEDRVAQRTIDHLCPEPMAPLLEPVSLSVARFGSVPKFYIGASDDRAMPPDAQRKMAERGGATFVGEIDSDHSPFLSAPDELIDVLLRTASSATARPRPVIERTSMSVEDQALIEARDDIASLSSWPTAELFRYDRQEIEDLQLHWLKRRFSDMRMRVPALDRLASSVGVDEIVTLDDAIPLCMPHTMYKAYSERDVERGRFERLTNWLDTLSVHDLSSVDSSGAQSLSEWLACIEAQTPLWPYVSSGTTGKISIYPKTKLEGHYLSRGLLRNAAPCGDDPGIDILSGRYPFICPWPVGAGQHTLVRLLDYLRTDVFDRPDEMVLTLGDDRLGVDELWLAGKLRRAQTSGEELSLTPREEQIQARMIAHARGVNQQERLDSFIDRTLVGMAGQTVGCLSHWQGLLQVAERCQARGITARVDPGSTFIVGGGSKGFAMPENWRAIIDDALPVRIIEVYGMSETSAQARMCHNRRYHVPPWGISWVVDPRTSEPYPRSGVQTGRHVVFDLLTENYWSGTLSGDEVTIHWDGDCGCGLRGPYVGAEINRYTDGAAADDKISCAKTPGAYRDLVQFSLSGE